MNEEIKTIFSNFTVDNEQIDVAHIKYKGHNKKYVTWTLLPEEPALSYDDEIQYSTVMVDIDIYSDGNYLNIMEEIKNKMKESEWIWDEDSEEMYEDDTGLYHRTITFKKERYL